MCLSCTECTYVCTGDIESDTYPVKKNIISTIQLCVHAKHKVPTTSRNLCVKTSTVKSNIERSSLCNQRDLLSMCRYYNHTETYKRRRRREAKNTRFGAKNQKRKQCNLLVET